MWTCEGQFGSKPEPFHLVPFAPVGQPQSEPTGKGPWETQPDQEWTGLEERAGLCTMVTEEERVRGQTSVKFLPHKMT